MKTYKDKANNEVHVLNMLILVSVDDRDIIVKNDKITKKIDTCFIIIKFKRFYSIEIHYISIY